MRELVVTILLVVVCIAWLISAGSFVAIMLAERRNNKRLAESFYQAEKDSR